MTDSSYARLERLGRVRLSTHFFFREFLHSEIAQFYGLTNAPGDADLAIAAGRRLCEELLEPLQETLGRISIRSGFRSCEVNAIGNKNGHNCATNEKNYGGHIWDRRDAQGNMGAMACIVIPNFTDHLERGGDWRELAWWIHDSLPYSFLGFYPTLGAFNIRWSEARLHRIDSYISPKGTLTKPGMANHGGSHADHYTTSPLFRIDAPID
ncbi:MAG: hypothetical protein O7E57_05960 [Gammaproteobacteria bacterium]|nr:hypothetical protein [Gammaproteobacteria bacterium]